MTEDTISIEEAAPVCPVCDHTATSLINVESLSPELQDVARANATASDLSLICPRCVELFSRAKARLDSHAAIFAQTDHVLPTPLRLGVDDRFTGKGVTIAFLDSGFYSHPDLTKPVTRIVAYKNIFLPGDEANLLEAPDIASWHGMMTSVVAAGNGVFS